MSKRVKIGHVGIDSGTLILIDPCYVKYIKDIHTDDQKTWSHFCKDVLADMDEKYDFVECNEGIIFSNRIGDGSFPVYAHYDEDHRIKKIEVVF